MSDTDRCPPRVEKPGHPPDPHADMVAASVAPDVVGHLKPDDQDAQVDLLGTLAQRVRALELVEPSLGRVIVGRVVLVDAFTFTLEGNTPESGIDTRFRRKKRSAYIPAVS